MFSLFNVLFMSDLVKVGEEQILEVLSDVKSGFSCRNQEKQQKCRRCIVHQPHNKSNASNSVCCKDQLLTVPEPTQRLWILSRSLPSQATTQLNNSQTLPQFVSESPFCKSRGRPTPASALLGRRGGREGRRSPVLVAFSWLWRGAVPSCPSRPGSRS